MTRATPVAQAEGTTRTASMSVPGTSGGPVVVLSIAQRIVAER